MNLIDRIEAAARNASPTHTPYVGTPGVTSGPLILLDPETVGLMVAALRAAYSHCDHVAGDE